MSEPPPAETARATERRGSGGWDRVLKDEQHLVSPGSEWRSELYRVAIEQFSRAAGVLGLSADIRLTATDRWGVDWRTAAQAGGIEPVAEASHLRSVYP